MAKSEVLQVVTAKLPAEVIKELGDFAEQVGTSRNALMTEAVETYLGVLRTGRRVFREQRLPEGGAR